MSKKDQDLFADILSAPGGRERLLQFVKESKIDSYDNFIECLYLKLDEIFEKLEETRDKKFSEDEDSITSVIAGRLEEAGYRATEQTKKNGAVDLTVELGPYKWIAEAKIGYSNSKILEGLLQLVTRYVTRDKDAGLLVYMKRPNCQKYIQDWHDFLNGSEKLQRNLASRGEQFDVSLNTVFNDVYMEKEDEYKMVGNLKKVDGSSIKVRHFFCDLYFNPADKSGISGKQQRINVAYNELGHFYYEQKESGAEFDINKCMSYLGILFED